MAAAGTKEYVVTTNAITVRLDKDNVGTYGLGAILELTEEQAKPLLAQLAVAPNDGKPKSRTTATQLTQAVGADGDPVPVPEDQILEETDSTVTVRKTDTTQS